KPILCDIHMLIIR
ncbi:Hypothetical protein EIN_431720, partial [Entamoeba invadens IP1]